MISPKAYTPYVAPKVQVVSMQPATLIAISPLLLHEVTHEDYESTDLFA